MSNKILNVLIDREKQASQLKWNPCSYQDSLFSKHLEKSNHLYKKDLKSHYGCVNAIEFSNDGLFLASGGDDRRILLWNLEAAYFPGYEPISLNSMHNSNVFCLAFDSENTKIFSGGNDQQVIIHDAITHRALDVFLHEEAIYSISVNPVSSSVFTTAGEDGQILLFDSRVYSSTGPTQISSSYCAYHSVQYNPRDPNYILTANSKEGVALWDVRKSKKAVLKYGCKRSIESTMCARFNSDGSQLLVLRRRMSPSLYNVDSRSSICEFDANNYYNSCTMKSCCFFGAQDEFVLSGSDDFNVYMWKIPRNQSKNRQSVHSTFKTLKGHRSIVNQVRFNSKNFLIASAGVEKVVKLWSVLPTPYSYVYDDKNINRRIYSHQQYLSLVLNSGQNPNHNYRDQNTSEDSKMIAFFDSLVQRDVEGSSSSSNFSDNEISELSLTDNSDNESSNCDVSGLKSNLNNALNSEHYADNSEHYADNSEHYGVKLFLKSEHYTGSFRSSSTRNTNSVNKASTSDTDNYVNRNNQNTKKIVPATTCSSISNSPINANDNKYVELNSNSFSIKSKNLVEKTNTVNEALSKIQEHSEESSQQENFRANCPSETLAIHNTENLTSNVLQSVSTNIACNEATSSILNHSKDIIECESSSSQSETTPVIPPLQNSPNSQNETSRPTLTSPTGLRPDTNSSLRNSWIIPEREISETRDVVAQSDSRVTITELISRKRTRLRLVKRRRHLNKLKNSQRKLTSFRNSGTNFQLPNNKFENKYQKISPYTTVSIHGSDSVVDQRSTKKLVNKNARTKLQKLREKLFFKTYSSTSVLGNNSNFATDNCASTSGINFNSTSRNATTPDSCLSTAHTPKRKNVKANNLYPDVDTDIDIPLHCGENCKLSKRSTNNGQLSTTDKNVPKKLDKTNKEK